MLFANYVDNYPLGGEIKNIIDEYFFVNQESLKNSITNFQV